MKKYNSKNIYSIILVICVLLLVSFGMLMVFSASKYQAEQIYGDKYFFLKKQVIGAVIGLAVMVAMYFLDVEKLRKLDWVVLAISIIGLVLVFVPGLGKTNYGASRWIRLGPVSVQPSEIAKLGFIFFSASKLSQNKSDTKKFKSMLPTLLSGGLICLLIIMEPNMSITMCVGLCMLTMLFVGGSSLLHFGLLLIPIVLLVPLLIIIEPYRLQRLSAYLDPWSSPLEEGFQLIQSYYALGSGGVTGVGYGNSRQKNLFLPFAESDFIYSIIGEEFGFVVCVLIILVYLVIVICGLKIAKNANTRFKCYLATSITALIAIQSLLNVAVVTGSIPPTGLPLPFISAGSTSLVAFMGASGMLVSIARQGRKGKLET